jgi:ketosteroid isomerase-like protein
LAREVRAAVDGFIDALNRLDVAAMERHFADDVTAFVPQAQAELAVGRAAVTNIFRRFADRVRPTTPRLALEARDVRVAVGDPLAVVTLHVRDGDGRMLRRRTFVLRRADGRWRISHLHASDLPADPARPPAP